ncbi:LysM peptidoglycan-binding domain-containing protein [Longimicrobium sp.]|uniref:LysM peptidoglycan-binding domain-containing protein n=1 Tax=Longimicrobium sp. TaxID=2029185 RepID=UPI002F93A87A
MHRKISTGLVVLSALGAAACTGSRPPAAPAPAPAVVQAPPPPVDTLRPLGEGFGLQGTRPEAVGGDLLGTAQYDLPVVANEWVRLEVDFLVNQRKSVVAGWLRQADRYDEWVRDVFASYGIPRDLHHLGMVESGYRATVRSHAGAVGMWQFMPATGRGMGLRIDSLVDERMDPVRATHAAARHLRQLNREFRGDWALAAAAYNAGSGRINRGLGRYNATNFWDLAQRGDLAQETRHYVPRLYAVTIIAKDPARFGYPAPSGPGERFSYDSVRVDLATPLSVLAQAGNIPVQQLVDLNPHMLRQVAPANYFVWVPAGQAAALRQAYAESEFRRRGGFAYYRVREGDSLQRLADLSGVSQDRIRSLNLSANLDALRPGERLRLFADAARTLNARPVERVARRESRERESGSAEERSSESRSWESRSSESRSSESRGERSANAEREGRSAESRNASASRSSSERGNSAERSTSGDRSERSSSSASSARRTESGESRPERSASAASRSEGSSSGASSRNASGSSRNGESSPRPASSGASSSRAASASSASRSASSSSGAASGRTHKVEDGESLWGIARKYDVTVDAVRAANDMENETIQPGQTLRIPRASSSATASTARSDSARRSASTSTRPSDGERRASSASSGTARTPSAGTGSTERRASASTSGSAERRTGSRADSSASRERRVSASASGSASGERGSSSAGSTERRSSTAASGQRANSTASAARAPETGSRSARRHHTVASGETLWSIARQYNTSVDTLRRANNLASDAQIQPGQRLAIPAAD